LSDSPFASAQAPKACAKKMNESLIPSGLRQLGPKPI